MTERTKVLLVEDEPTLAMIVAETLTREGFDVVTATDGESGLRQYYDLRPDIVVADVMMPRLDGFEMVRRLRQTDRHVPVLMLTARSAIDDVVHGFEIGANDYLRKPFGMQELIVRIKSLTGQLSAAKHLSPTAGTTDDYVFSIGLYTLDARSQRLILAGQTIELSHREAEILRRLCMSRGDVVTTQAILLDLWGDDTFFNARSLNVFITKLRHKLARDPQIRIVNVRGVGYKLIEG